MAEISVKRHDTFLAHFPFVDSGEPANLAGCSARMQLRDRALTLFINTSTDDYLSIEGNMVVAKIPPSLMTVPVGKYQADIQLTYPDGSVRSSETFVVKVVQDITYDDTE